MKTTWLVMLVLAVCVAGCGRDAGERGRTASEESAAEAGVPSGTRTEGRDVEPVDAGTLRSLLPEALDGRARKNIDANRDGAMGFYVTTATAAYGDEGIIEIAIIDLGGIARPSMMGYAWTEEEMDRETSGGYERTVAFKGYKAHQKYDEDTERGEMAVLVADRFIVAVEGDGVSMNDIEDALNRIDLDRLDALRGTGVRQRE